MAMQATHIILANKIYHKFLADKNLAEFLIGNVFPDIRYIDKIPREQTHFANVTLKDLKNADSFMAGVKCHSMVDELREKFLAENGLY